MPQLNLWDPIKEPSIPKRRNSQRETAEASTHNSHPIQSNIAADSLNHGDRLKCRQMAVLKALAAFGMQTAKQLDVTMEKAYPEWSGWAHKRMRELALKGFVTRDRRGREMVCKITERGEKELKRWKQRK